MQREIEALMRAHHDDQVSETRLVQDVLAALAVGARSRRLMVEELATVLARAKNDLESRPTEHLTKIDEALTSAVRQLRVS